MWLNQDGIIPSMFALHLIKKVKMHTHFPNALARQCSESIIFVYSGATLLHRTTHAETA